MIDTCATCTWFTPGDGDREVWMFGTCDNPDSVNCDDEVQPEDWCVVYEAAPTDYDPDYFEAEEAYQRRYPGRRLYAWEVNNV